MKSKKLALSVFTATTFFTVAASAWYGYWDEYMYYSDASYTIPVGEKTITCSGRSYVSGEVTPYAKRVIHQPC